MSNANQNNRHAIVLSGIGPNAAYEVGVLKALLQEERKHARGARWPISPAIYTGTCMGALNAAIMAGYGDHSDHEGINYLEKLWTNEMSWESRHGGLIRFRGNPLELLDPRSYYRRPFQTTANLGRDGVKLLGDYFLRKTTQVVSGRGTLEERLIDLSEVSAFIDYSQMEKFVSNFIEPARIKASKRQLRIATVNWESGKTVIFKNEDFIDQRGKKILTAAATLPGLMQPVTMADERFVGAPILLDHPLGPAIHAFKSDAHRGSSHLNIHAVYFDPEVVSNSIPKVGDALSATYRLFLLAASRSVNADIQRVESTNRDLVIRRLIDESDRSPAHSSSGSSRPEESQQDLVFKIWNLYNRDTKDKAEITIHRYRPSKRMSSIFDLIRLEPEEIADLIDAGYHDTVKHDCEKCGCIIADSADG